jgi:hypothetical protein
MAKQLIPWLWPSKFRTFWPSRSFRILRAEKKIWTIFIGQRLSRNYFFPHPPTAKKYCADKFWHQNYCAQLILLSHDFLKKNYLWPNIDRNRACFYQAYYRNHNNLFVQIHILKVYWKFILSCNPAIIVSILTTKIWFDGSLSFIA